MKRKYLLLSLMVLVLALPGCFGEGCNVTTPTAYPPSDLAAAAVSSSEIDLTWKDNSPDETGFYIYRKTAGSYSKVAATEANSTSYSDTGLDPYSTYWYQVCAYNAGGNSEFSNEASARTLEEVEILDYHMEEKWIGDEWRTDIVGNVKNNTGGPLTVWIKGAFFVDNVEVANTNWSEFVGAGATKQFSMRHWSGLKERISQVKAWVHKYY